MTIFDHVHSCFFHETYQKTENNLTKGARDFSKYKKLFFSSKVKLRPRETVFGIIPFFKFCQLLPLSEKDI